VTSPLTPLQKERGTAPLPIWGGAGGEVKFIVSFFDILVYMLFYHKKFVLIDKNLPD